MLRTKNKYQVQFGIPQYYKYYIKNFAFNPFASKFSEPSKIIASRAVYSKILEDLFLQISRKVLASDLVSLPCNLGYIGVKKKKMNFEALKEHRKLHMDYKEYMKSGLKVFFTNDHTDNYYYKFIWNKRSCKISNISFYKFIPNRKNKRTLAKYLKNKQQDYIEIEQPNYKAFKNGTNL